MGTEQVSDVFTRLLSANVTTMLVPKMMVSWYFSTNFAATKLWLAPLSTKDTTSSDYRSTSPLRNRVASLGLALMGAVHKHPKNCNFFNMQA